MSKSESCDDKKLSHFTGRSTPYFGTIFLKIFGSLYSSRISKRHCQTFSQTFDSLRHLIIMAVGVGNLHWFYYGLYLVIKKKIARFCAYSFEHWKNWCPYSKINNSNKIPWWNLPILTSQMSMRPSSSGMMFIWVDFFFSLYSKEYVAVLIFF